MEIVEGEATHFVDIHPRVNESLLAEMVDRISKSLPSTLPREVTQELSLMIHYKKTIFLITNH
jgi:hypothetical protein